MWPPSQISPFTLQMTKNAKKRRDKEQSQTDKKYNKNIKCIGRNGKKPPQKHRFIELEPMLLTVNIQRKNCYHLLKHIFNGKSNSSWLRTKILHIKPSKLWEKGQNKEWSVGNIGSRAWDATEYVSRTLYFWCNNSKLHVMCSKGKWDICSAFNIPGKEVKNS